MEAYYTITTIVNNKSTYIQLIKSDKKTNAIRQALKNIILTDEDAEENINIKIVVEN